MQIPLAFKLDTPNYNNRIYKSRAVKRALKDLKNNPLPVMLGCSDDCEVEHHPSVGYVDDCTFGKDGTLEFTATIVDEKIKELISETPDVAVGFRGFGFIGEDNVVKSLEIIGVDLVDKDHYFLPYPYTWWQKVKQKVIEVLKKLFWKR